MADSNLPPRKFADRYQVSPLTVLYDLIKNYFFAIVGAAFLALVLRVYVVEAFRIPTDFMAPMLLPGDHIFVNKLAYGGAFWIAAKKPAPGDVIIFSFPNDPTKDYIKRVIGVEGDTIEIKTSQVLLNGKLISRPQGVNAYEEEIQGHHYFAQWNGAMLDSRKMPQVKVPAGHVFVLGDNRAKGQDSRGYGFLPLSHIKGRASMIWFSMGAVGPGSALGVRWSRLMTKVN